MRILSFDIWGDYGHFKKFHTTSSPLSFSLPPPTAVYGMIGAIMGLHKNEYLNKLQEWRLTIAIEINKPVKKIRLGVNWIELKKSFDKLERAPQIKQEFLKDCSFSIYISGKDNFLDEFKSFLVEHKSVYTPCIGITQCLANFKFTGEFNGQIKSLSQEEEIYIHTAIPCNYKIKIEKEKTYHKERLPVIMKQDRQVIDYRDILYESKGDTICIKGGDYIDLDKEKAIVFLNS